MTSPERLVIAVDAADLVQRHALAIEMVAAILGRRLRDERVQSIRVERAREPGVPLPDGLVIRVVMPVEVEEAQHLWELIEQDLNELQRAAPPDQRRALAEQISVVVDWSGHGIRDATGDVS